MPRQLVLIRRFATETRRANFQSFPSSFPFVLARGQCDNPVHVSRETAISLPLHNVEFTRSYQVLRNNLLYSDGNGEL